MFSISIRTGNGDQDKEIFKGYCQNDWQRDDMAKAIELAIGGPGGVAGGVSIVRNRRGSPKVCGELTLWVWTTDEWLNTLGSILVNAKWDYATRRGYGDFIERLLAHKHGT